MNPDVSELDIDLNDFFGFFAESNELLVTNGKTKVISEKLYNTILEKIKTSDEIFHSSSCETLFYGNDEVQELEDKYQENFQSETVSKYIKARRRETFPRIEDSKKTDKYYIKENIIEGVAGEIELVTPFELQKEIQELKYEIAKLRDTNNTLRSQLNYSEEINNKLQQDIEEVYTQLHTLQNLLKSGMDEKEKECEALRHELETQETLKSTFQAKVSAYEKENRAIREELQNMEIQISELVQENESIKSNEFALEQSMAELRTTTRELQMENEALRSQVGIISENFEDMRISLEEEKYNNKRLSDDISFLKDELTRIQCAGPRRSTVINYFGEAESDFEDISNIDDMFDNEFYSKSSNGSYEEGNSISLFEELKSEATEMEYPAPVNKAILSRSSSCQSFRTPATSFASTEDLVLQEEQNSILHCSCCLSKSKPPKRISKVKYRVIYRRRFHQWIPRKKMLKSMSVAVIKKLLSRNRKLKSYASHLLKESDDYKGALIHTRVSLKNVQEALESLCFRCSKFDVGGDVAVNSKSLIDQNKVEPNNEAKTGGFTSRNIANSESKVCEGVNKQNGYNSTKLLEITTSRVLEDLERLQDRITGITSIVERLSENIQSETTLKESGSVTENIEEDDAVLHCREREELTVEKGVATTAESESCTEMGTERDDLSGNTVPPPESTKTSRDSSLKYCVTNGQTNQGVIISPALHIEKSVDDSQKLPCFEASSLSASTTDIQKNVVEDNNIKNTLDNPSVHERINDASSRFATWKEKKQLQEAIEPMSWTRTYKHWLHYLYSLIPFSGLFIGDIPLEGKKSRHLKSRSTKSTKGSFLNVRVDCKFWIIVIVILVVFLFFIFSQVIVLSLEPQCPSLFHPSVQEMFDIVYEVDSIVPLYKRLKWLNSINTC